MVWTGAATKAKQRWQVTETCQNGVHLWLLSCKLRGWVWNSGISVILAWSAGDKGKGRWTKCCTVHVLRVELQSVPYHFALLAWKNTFLSFILKVRRFFGGGPEGWSTFCTALSPPVFPMVITFLNSPWVAPSLPLPRSCISSASPATSAPSRAPCCDPIWNAGRKLAAVTFRSLTLTRTERSHFKRNFNCLTANYIIKVPW